MNSTHFTVQQIYCKGLVRILGCSSICQRSLVIHVCSLEFRGIHNHQGMSGPQLRTCLAVQVIGTTVAQCCTMLHNVAQCCTYIWQFDSINSVQASTSARADMRTSQACHVLEQCFWDWKFFSKSAGMYIILLGSSSKIKQNDKCGICMKLWDVSV